MEQNFFHMNVSSLCHNFDDLQTLLTRINIKFNIIGITATRLKGYTVEHTQTEANCGGALLYIENSMNYTIRGHLKIYKRKELYFIFIEVIKFKGRNLIIGCIYRHPSMNLTEFTDIYISELLRKISKEDKKSCVYG